MPIEEPPLIAKILRHVLQREALNDPVARTPPGQPEQTLNLIRCPEGGQPRGWLGYDAGIESSRVVGAARRPETSEAISLVFLLD